MSDSGPDASRFIPWILAAVGTIGATLWGAVKTSRTAEDAAKEKLRTDVLAEKDKRIAVLEADKERLEKVIQELGAKLDVKTAQLLRVAVAVARGRRDPAIPNEFEEAYPSAVTNLADLVDPLSRPKEEQKADPELDAMLSGFNPTEKTPPKLKPPR